MRRASLLFVVGLLGCAKLNAAYGDDEASTGDVVESGTTDKPTPSTSASASAGPSTDVTTDVDPATGPGGTAVDPDTTNAEGSASEAGSDGSSSTAGAIDGRVVLLWRSSIALAVGRSTPQATCQTEPPLEADRCGMSPGALLANAPP